MKKTTWRLIAATLILTLMAAACGPQAVPTAAPPPPDQSQKAAQVTPAAGVCPVAIPADTDMSELRLTLIGNAWLMYQGWLSPTAFLDVQTWDLNGEKKTIRQIAEQVDPNDVNLTFYGSDGSKIFAAGGVSFFYGDGFSVPPNAREPTGLPCELLVALALVFGQSLTMNQLGGQTEGVIIPSTLPSSVVWLVDEAGNAYLLEQVMDELLSKCGNRYGIRQGPGTQAVTVQYNISVAEMCLISAGGVAAVYGGIYILATAPELGPFIIYGAERILQAAPAIPQ